MVTDGLEIGTSSPRVDVPGLGCRDVDIRPTAPSTPGAADTDLVQALRAGNETVFADLVDRLTPAMLAVARHHVPSQQVAEDVVQETWLGVLTGLDRFEGRSSLRGWVFAILLNIAKRRGARERRSIPFSSAFPADRGGPTVDPGRFRPPGDEWPGHWAAPPRPWELPESAMLSREVRLQLARALETLPDRQRTVVRLRDVHGLDAEEVCALLDIEPGTQRGLLHRGRARLRQALEDYIDEERA
jgi:RNA polymerase sigma-70 factor (ECF subfamily)